MTLQAQLRSPTPPPEVDSARLMASARCSGDGVGPYLRALREDAARVFVRTAVTPLSQLGDWSADPDGGVLRHRSGRFFTVEGRRMRMGAAHGPQVTWDQPIIVQPEVGLLGIVAREFDGVLHVLLQNKVEPGNRNGIQLSPTVQATRSNFTRVHGGDAVPYLGCFLDPGSLRHRVVTDVRQSEHGSWFLRKRNRNVVIEVEDEIEVREGFHWLTLGQVAELLQVDDLVNMETRSVLSCLPYFSQRTPADAQDGDGFAAALRRSCHADQPSVLTRTEVASWVTRARADHEARDEPVPLTRLRGWSSGTDRIARDDGRFFEVVGVEVVARGREVRSWDQPMVAAGDRGVVALVLRRFDGVVHALVHLRAEGGNADGPEIAPTVQCNPGNYEGEHAAARPVLLDRVLAAAPGTVRYDAMLSDEGGRFYHVSHRHLLVECDDVEAPPGFRWLTLHQLGELLQHSNYLNVQTRSLVACLQSLLAQPTA